MEKEFKFPKFIPKRDHGLTPKDLGMIIEPPRVPVNIPKDEGGEDDNG